MKNKQMKRQIIILLLSLLIAGCNIYELPSTYNFLVTVNYPNNINKGAPIKNRDILIRELQTGREYTKKTDTTGVVTFNVRGGNYSIIISFEEKHEININGYTTEKTLLFNGAINSAAVLNNESQFSIQTEYSILNEGFVIKELYTSGCRIPEGRLYSAAKFVEIYNNSNHILFSDGLCFGVVYHKRTYTPNIWVDSEGKMLPRIPIWSYVAIVPGTGKEHPIQPGESFIIALSAINHKDDPNGTPNSIDLSGATWEMQTGESRYVDNPLVPNILMYKISKALYSKTIAISPRGQISIIFKLPTNNLNSIFLDPNNYMIEPGGSENCFMVPFGWVIDGVENVELHNSVFKSLPNRIDIGYIQHRGSGERVSIKRKVKEVINGRTIYQDTNNSTNDFLTNQNPTPGVIAKN
jgi:hypothetical protein